MEENSIVKMMCFVRHERIRDTCAYRTVSIKEAVFFMTFSKGERSFFMPRFIPVMKGGII